MDTSSGALSHASQDLGLRHSALGGGSAPSLNPFRVILLLCVHSHEGQASMGASIVKKKAWDGVKTRSNS